MNFDVIYYLLVFTGGAFIGSFLNLVSDRLINGEPILFGRSHCDFCKKPLAPKNLIPILSFLIQKGKCSFCDKKLSRFYLMSEILTGLALILATYYSGILRIFSFRDFWDFLLLSLVFCVFITIILTDLKYYLIPDVVVYLGIAITIIFVVGGYAMDLYSYYRRLASDPLGIKLIEVGFWNSQLKYALESLGVTFVSALAIALFFLLLVWLTKERGMGSGDVKLGFLIGIFNGFPGNVMAIFLGFIFGASLSLFLIIFKRKTLKDSVPFGPFLLAGSITSLLYGSNILDWYINLF
jgi:leader peptidase (prepilin peptidase)/N-methyltransferase